jgi:hypothetical protein
MRYIFSFLLLCSGLFPTAHAADSMRQNGLRISILTCGVGEELYASFGHSAIRIIDSARGTDEVYNYGTFDFSDPDFYSKFTLGKLLYYLDKSTYTDFLAGYVEEKRSIKEQVLNLAPEPGKKIYAFLENNLKPENRAYHYDFLFDNCTTRIRDIFPKALGAEFFWGAILNNHKASYRSIINQYLADKHWERFGINLLLGSPVDSLMTDDGAMFLPDFLYKGFQNAGIGSLPVVKADIQTLKQGYIPQRKLNGPLWTMIGLLIITILSFHLRAFRYLKPVIRFLLLFASGLLGCFMLFMWIGTEHKACSENYNILWALPPNLIIAFAAHKKSGLLKIYALAAISILMVGLLVHVIGLQKMPLIEMAPFLLCLMYVYLDLYKNNIHSLKPGDPVPQKAAP